ncbi:nitrous oxide reductase accessory protein NosL [Rhodobacter maris]|uniref:Copper chaperone NosL n=1 Tax=Rhodobacter maris TaxID=446682 RepID=A0A285TBK0_9RHOB|nr:copper chaperone NosL [Rhodobacter maris]
MKRLLLSLCLLAACRDDAAVPQPVSLSADAVGYFCQMNILDHGGPKAQVHLDVAPGKPLFFSQVRDALVYLNMSQKEGQVQATYVTDMAAGDWDAPATLPWIAADQAIYVVGSSRLGGMEEAETVPFATPEAAAAFIARYGGQALRLAEIPAAMLAPEAPVAEAGDEAGYAARLKAHAGHDMGATMGANMGAEMGGNMDHDMGASMGHAGHAMGDM